MDTALQSDEIILLITVGTLIMLLLAFSLIAFFLLSQRKLNNERQKAHTQELAYREQLLYSNLQTQENERQRIAKDLHDDVGSKLNVLHLHLHRLQKQMPDTPDATQTINEVFGLIHNTIGTTRQISHDLLPPTLENFGLSAALTELCGQHRQHGAIVFDFETDDQMTRLEKSVELNLFRVVQELIVNSVKHGPPTRILIQLWHQPDELNLLYTDNGPGFDPGLPNYKPGLGMLNIESRMRMIGADYSVVAAPGAGIQVNIKYTFQP